MKAFSTFPFFLLILNISLAQQRGDLLTDTLLQVYEEDDILEIYDIFGLPEFVCTIDYDVELYKVEYRTAAATGDSLTVASGLVTLPQSSTCDFPLVAYNHGSLLYDRTLSDLMASSSQHLVGVPFAANGYVGVLPDYLGYGATPVNHPHPYLHAESEATAVIDLLRAARRLASVHDVQLNDQVFLLGYSQGGHVTMATHRALERDYADEFTVTAAAPASGPYDLSGISRDSMLFSDRFSHPLFLAFTLVSYDFVYGDIYNDLSDAILPPYDTMIGQMLNREMPRSELLDSLPYPAYQMFQPLYFEAVVSDPQHPLNEALRKNDLYDWAPRAPVQMAFCEADERVPPANTAFTKAYMESLGAQEVSAFSAGPDKDHDGCTFPALVVSKLWFDTFRTPCSVPNEIVDAGPQPGLYPNPFYDVVHLDYASGAGHGFDRLTIYDMTGRMVLSMDVEGKQTVELPAGVLPAGSYLFEFQGRAATLRQLMVH